MTTRRLTAILSAALALATGPDVQLLPAGDFAGRDGRPGLGKAWRLDDAQGAAVAARLNARHADGKAKFGFDYGHQTMLAAQNGQPAPASGWARQFEWRPGQGLYALQVEWTQRARDGIAANEYLYISPVIAFDPDSGQVLDVLNAALTNYPNLMQLAEVSALQAALAAQLFSTENDDMALLAALCAALGLPATTTDEAALTAVNALRAKAEKPPAAVAALSAAMTGALGLPATADEAAALSAVAALKNKPAVTDPATLSTIAALQGTVAQLNAQMNEGKVAALVDGAIAAHKLLPAQKDWAIGLGKADIAQLNAFIAAAPVMTGLASTQSGGKDPAKDDDTKAPEVAVAVLSAMGLTADEFKAGATA